MFPNIPLIFRYSDESEYGSRKKTSFPLTLNPLFYFDGENINSLPEVNPIDNIIDLSGYNNNISQTDVNRKPLLAIEDGYRGASFDGTDDLLSRNDSLGLTGNPGLTIMLVIKLVPGNSNAIPIMRLGSTGDNFSVTYNIGDRFRVFANAITEFFTTLGQGGDIKVLTITKTNGGGNTTSRLWINNTEIFTSSPSGTPLNLVDNYFQLSFGTQQSTGPSYLFSGFIKGEEVTDEERQELLDFFYDKYNISP